MLRDILIKGADEGATRRRKTLTWVGQLTRSNPEELVWNKKAAEIDDAHWRDLQAGARFFIARDAALALLDVTEAHIGALAGMKPSLRNPLPEIIEKSIAALQARAQAFINFERDQSLFADRIAAVRNARTAVRWRS